MQIRSVVVVVALGLASFAHGQQAVQWRVEDGGNGHWYQGILTSSTGASWSASREIAISFGGDLSKVQSAIHLQWLFSRVVNVPLLWSDAAGPWVGALQASGAAEPTGGWTWVDGTSIAAGVWSDGQPDDYLGCGGNNNRMAFWNAYTGVPQPFLEDSPDGQSFTPCVGTRISAIVEWSADCNGDGIVDYGQILDGTFADVNSNGVPDTCECLADLTGDGVVNGGDLSIVLGFWGTPAKTLPAADLNRDGIVDAADLAAILGSWGPCP